MFNDKINEKIICFAGVIFACLFTFFMFCKFCIYDYNYCKTYSSKMCCHYEKDMFFSDDILNTYSQNEKTGDSLYSNRYITVFGNVADIKNENNSICLYVKSSDKIRFNIKMHISPENKLWKNGKGISKGDFIAVNGICIGKTIENNILFSNCFIESTCIVGLEKIICLFKLMD